MSATETESYVLNLSRAATGFSAHRWIWPSAARYVLAFGFVVAAILVTLILQQFEATRPTLFMFFAAIVASAWFGGLGPGFFALMLSAPAGLYFYAGALHSYALSVDSIVLLTFFVACAIAGGLLNQRQRQADEALRKTHKEVQSKATELQSTNNELMAQIAERQRAERALRETQSELMRVARLTTMGQLSASIAHEINQPLAGVVSNAGSCIRWLNADPPDLTEARASAQRIVRDGTRASEVIHHVRTMVRRGLPEKDYVDVNKAVESVLSLTQNELRAQQISVKTKLAGNLPALLGDRVQLQQLILNLIMNAIESIADGAQNRRLIAVATSVGDDNSLCLSVEDTGPGIAPDVAYRLFDAFVTTKPNGMGLGLAICSTIVEAHGGTISAAQGELGGALFEVRLPLDEDQL